MKTAFVVLRATGEYSSMIVAADRVFETACAAEAYVQKKDDLMARVRRVHSDAMHGRSSYRSHYDLVKKADSLAGEAMERLGMTGYDVRDVVVDDLRFWVEQCPVGET